MRKINLRECVILFVALFSANVLNAQITFEELSLQPNTYWNGSDENGGFLSEDMFFVNYYDTAYGGSWSGFSYSNMKDTTTAGYTNMYSAFAGSGYEYSNNFAVAYASAWGGSTYTTFNKSVAQGFYVTNTSYAYLSMKDGDFSGKKFGSSTNAAGDDDGTNGDDWFMLTVEGYNNGSLVGNVDFYLADYRFADSTQNYIVKTWEYVDLSSLNEVDSLVYLLSSSDVGDWGMNTPAYFCIDNIFISSTEIQIVESEKIRVYPNPCINNLLINADNQIYKIEIIDILGNIVFVDEINMNNTIVDFTKYISGIYFVNVYTDKGVETKKIVKQ